MLSLLVDIVLSANIPPSIPLLFFLLLANAKRMKIEIFRDKYYLPGCFLSLVLILVEPIEQRIQRDIRFIKLKHGSVPYSFSFCFFLIASKIRQKDAKLFNGKTDKQILVCLHTRIWFFFFHSDFTKSSWFCFLLYNTNNVHYSRLILKHKDMLNLFVGLFFYRILFALSSFRSTHNISTMREKSVCFFFFFLLILRCMRMMGITWELFMTMPTSTRNVIK